MLTVIVCEAELDPRALVAVNVAVKVPVVVNVCEGDGEVDVPPFPKVQAQLVGEPLLVSVKFTASGAVPLVGVAVKLAVGADGWLTVMVRDVELDPWALDGQAGRVGPSVGVGVRRRARPSTCHRPRSPRPSSSAPHCWCR